MRKFLKVSCLGLGLLLVSGVIFEQWARSEAREAFPPPGRMIQVNGNDLHLHCTGSGSPTVVLESGTGSPSSVWSQVQPQVAEFTRVCSYDRSGLGWSRGREVRGAVEAAEDLHDLLNAASEQAPYILVGHSLGGARNLVYFRNHPSQVAGLIFVDATHPDWRVRLPAEIREEHEAAPLHRRLLFWMMTEAGGLRIFQRAVADEPDDPAASQMRAFSPQNMRQAMREGAATEQILREASLSRTLGDRPTIVLSAGNLQLPTGISPGARAEAEALKADLQQELAQRSSRGEFRIVQGSGHAIPVEAPLAVTSAIEEVVEAVNSTNRNTASRE